MPDSELLSFPAVITSLLFPEALDEHEIMNSVGPFDLFLSLSLMESVSGRVIVTVKAVAVSIYIPSHRFIFNAETTFLTADTTHREAPAQFV
jgi:hypothetical protein